MAGPLIPERVPPLPDRLLSLLRSMPPGREVTAATLTGWLSVTEDSADVAAALDALRAQRLAAARKVTERGKRPHLVWSLP